MPAVEYNHKIVFHDPHAFELRSAIDKPRHRDIGTAIELIQHVRITERDHIQSDAITLRAHPVCHRGHRHMRGVVAHRQRENPVACRRIERLRLQCPLQHTQRVANTLCDLLRARSG
jgi:hypothetical protein